MSLFVLNQHLPIALRIYPISSRWRRMSSLGLLYYNLPAFAAGPAFSSLSCQPRSGFGSLARLARWPLQAWFPWNLTSFPFPWRPHLWPLFPRQPCSPPSIIALCFSLFLSLSAIKLFTSSMVSPYGNVSVLEKDFSSHTHSSVTSAKPASGTGFNTSNVTSSW